MFSDFAWLLKDHLKFELFFESFCCVQNNCLHVTSICLSTSTVPTLCTLIMELPKLQDCRAEIVQVENIKILYPQKLAKYCLSDIGFPPFLMKHKAVLMQFGLALDIIINNDTAKKALEVYHKLLSGVVVVVGYYVADSLSTSSPLLASSSSNKSVLSVSTKPPLSNV